MLQPPRFARDARLLLLPVLLLALALPAAANANQGVVVGAPAPSWQTNGPVWALAAANGAVYVGGSFTSVRPPGAPAGTGEVPRNHLAAFDAATGDLLPFNPDLDASVYALVASPDGSRVYAGGDFKAVGGVAVHRLAAFDTSTGALIRSWKATASSSVRALEAFGGTVYVGGHFQSLNSQPRIRLGAVDATTGALTPWAPSADAQVLAISSSKDGANVYVGGRFGVVNGSPQHAIAALSASTGAVLPFPAAAVIPPCSSVKDLTTDATTVYSANEGDGSGCFDGTFAANVSDGSLKWRNGCLGATQAIEVIGDFLYKGSHAHDCSSVIGGFPETGFGGRYHLLAQDLSDGLLGPWYLSTNGKQLGPRAFATDGQRLFLGGDFTLVNSLPQQGFARFEAGPGTNKPFRPAAPKVASVEPGAVRVVVTATWDRDNNDLTYHLLRDGRNTPIKTWTLSSKPWSRPTVVDVDSGLEPGSTHTYRVLASDGTNHSFKSNVSAPVVVSDATGSYADHVNADFPSFYWRLGEMSGSTANDATGSGRSGIYMGGVAKGQAGALLSDSDTAVAFDGASGRVSAASSGAGAQTFTAEAWIRTTTRTGGKIIGFGNSQTGTSSSHDRHIYMTNAGQLVFGVFAGRFPSRRETITSPGAYNNGQWHHVAATLGPSGMALYVDGTLVGTNPTTVAAVFSGYWRVGGDNLSGWPLRPNSAYFRGAVDEVAVYPYAVSAAQVAERYASR